MGAHTRHLTVSFFAQPAQYGQRRQKLTSRPDVPRASASGPSGPSHIPATLYDHLSAPAVENKFATGDFVMRTYRGISVTNASGIVEQRNAHDFDRPLHVISDRRKRRKAGSSAPEPEARRAGFFWRLTAPMRHALLRVAA